MEQPRTLGRYQLLRMLGRGSMGVVYEGLDPKLNRPVAVKTILKSQLLDPVLAAEYTARFMREAQAIARLNHPNIVSVFDFGDEADVAYLVMEFVRGRELKGYLDEKRLLGLEEVVHIVSELLQALNYAHQHGVIHRDVKPANVMLDQQGRVKLTDFGVARLFDTSAAEGTGPGTMVGTPGYMAPEQIKGLAVGPLADIFATGVVLYQCLTLKKPFTANSDWELYQKIVNEEPPPLAQFRNDVPAALEAVLRRALAKEPKDRYPSAGAMADALRQSVSKEIFDDEATRLFYDARPAGFSPEQPGTGSSTTGSSATGSPHTEQYLWNSIKDSDDIEGLRKFLANFPYSVYASLAKTRIHQLSGQLGDQDAQTHLTAESEPESAILAETQYRVPTTTRIKAEEEARHHLDMELQRQAQKEAQQQRDEEARQQAELEARRKAEEELRLEQEAARLKEVEDRQRAEAAAQLALEAEHRAQEEARLRAEAEAARQAELEAQRQAELEVQRLAEEAAQQTQAVAQTLAPPSEDAAASSEMATESKVPAATTSPMSLETMAGPTAPAEFNEQPPILSVDRPGKPSRTPIIIGIAVVGLMAAAASVFLGQSKDSSQVAVKPAETTPQMPTAPAPSGPTLKQEPTQEAPKNTPEPEKKAPEPPMKAPEVSEKAPEVPKKLPEPPRKVTEAPKRVPEAPKKAPNKASEVPTKAPEVPKKSSEPPRDTQEVSPQEAVSVQVAKPVHSIPPKAPEASSDWRAAMRADQGACRDKSTLEKAYCIEKVRWKYCADRWNQAEECKVTVRTPGSGN